MQFQRLDTQERRRLSSAFHSALLDRTEGSSQINYITERPFSEEALKTWKVGYCPPHVAYPFPLLRGRIVVPIWDMYGIPVAFTGRKLDAVDNELIKYYFQDFSPVKAMELFTRWDRAKWINEPYHKSHHLYGLNINRKEIQRLKYAIIVEGNFDVITLWDHGIRNVVGICGTKFSAAHLSLLLRTGISTIALLLDGDEAGKLSDRKTRSIVEKFSDINVLSIEMNGVDPEDHVRACGTQYLIQALNIGIKNNDKTVRLG